jgi:type IV pilus assembly protein PilW
MAKPEPLSLTLPAFSTGPGMKKQQGLSLIELMIAITLGLVLMGGVIQMFLSSRQVFSTQQAMSRMQESGRLSIEFMADDIRMAGYAGCADRNTQFENDLTESDVFNDFTAVSGPGPGFPFNSINGFASDDLPSGLTLDPEPVADSDLLVVRYAGGAPHIVATDVTPGEIKILAAGVVPAGNCVNGICKDATLLVSNCTGGHIFSAEDVSFDQISERTTITHSGDWPWAAPVIITKSFFSGDEVMPVASVLYYIGENPGGNPSLYRSEMGATAVEMLEGVENMSLRYGINAEYFAAGELSEAQWLNVNSVRIELLLRSNEENVLDSPQGYSFAGEDVEGPADKRARQIFRTTVALRNRIED